jgi:AhpD family alkylhydroperoxidase
MTGDNNLTDIELEFQNNEQTAEMIALGAAYGVNCCFCVECHKQKADVLFGNIKEVRCCPAGSDCCT